MKVKFFSARPYETNYLTEANNNRFEIHFEELPLSPDNTDSLKGFDVISVFTNDDLSAPVLEQIKANGVNYICIRATGYDHVNLDVAHKQNLTVANVPGYSPFSVAEHAIMLMLALNRKIILADQQVKQHDFTLSNLTGFDMHEKIVGIIGLGSIGQVVAKILTGFGCKILVYDPIVNQALVDKYGITYSSLKELLQQSDIITLHCPLNDLTRHLINNDSIGLMKKNVMLINCGRGGLIHTEDIIEGLKTGKIGYLGMDVYENEKGLFFFDHSKEQLNDSLLLKLLEFKNVVITPHQGFLTSTALKNIAETTFYNIECWAKGQKSNNEL